MQSVEPVLRLVAFSLLIMAVPCSADICLRGDTAQRIRVRDIAAREPRTNRDITVRQVEICSTNYSSPVRAAQPTTSPRLVCHNLVSENRESLERRGDQVMYGIIKDRALTLGGVAAMVTAGEAVGPVLTPIGAAAIGPAWAHSDLHSRLETGPMLDDAMRRITRTIPGICERPGEIFGRNPDTEDSFDEIERIAARFSTVVRRPAPPENQVGPTDISSGLTNGVGAH